MTSVIAVKQRATRAARLPVSDGNVRKAALRLLGQPLVSTEAGPEGCRIGSTFSG